MDFFLFFILAYISGVSFHQPVSSNQSNFTNFMKVKPKLHLAGKGMQVLAFVSVYVYTYVNAHT